MFTLTILAASAAFEPTNPFAEEAIWPDEFEGQAIECAQCNEVERALAEGMRVMPEEQYHSDLHCALFDFPELQHEALAARTMCWLMA